MREMGKRTADISSIVDTINLIAERTNLLSLNASIEAARAGDAGRGFAVVAEEIRNLADRSAKATADIAGIIRALQDVAQDAMTASTEGLRIADEGNALAEGSATGLRKILGGLAETTTLVGQIARATSEQRVAAQVVVRAIAETSDQVRQVASATAEQAGNASSIVQATGQMRKIAQEVSKAVSEQGRAARDVMKAALSTTKLATQVRKATAEQAKSAIEITQAVDSMRRGVGTTTRALGEQASASEQVLHSADSLARQAGTVARAMDEQTAAVSEIAKAVAAMRQEGQQAAKFLNEQSTAFKNFAAESGRAAKHLKQVTRANAEHSKVSADLLKQMEAIRGITTKNVAGVKDTRGNMTDLLSQAQILTDLMDGRVSNGGNGRRPRTTR